MIGKNFRTGPASQQQVFELPHSTARLTSPIDGKDRIISSRTLNKFPLVIVATTTTAAALADWREQITILVTVAGVSVLAIAILLFVVVRKLLLQHRAVAAPADAGKAAPRHRRQQHDAGPAAVRRLRSASSSATAAISRCTASPPTSSSPAAASATSSPTARRPAPSPATSRNTSTWCCVTSNSAMP